MPRGKRKTGRSERVPYRDGWPFRITSWGLREDRGQVESDGEMIYRLAVNRDCPRPVNGYINRKRILQLGYPGIAERAAETGHKKRRPGMSAESYPCDGQSEAHRVLSEN